MLMTEKGAQKVFVSSAKELFAAFKESGRTEMFGLTLSETETGYTLSNARFTVNVSAAGKFATSSKK